MTAGARIAGRDGGFTLLELTVVFGLLAGFLMLLTQILSSGVELFDEGETGQELADLGNAAATAVVESLHDVVGPEREVFDSAEPGARLLLEWVPLGLAADDGSATRVQALRATVRLDPAEEEALLRASLEQRAREAEGSADPDAVAERLADLVARAPRQGRGEMLLLPWPAGDPGGAFLELRRATLLPGHRIPVDRRRDVGLLEVERLDGGPVTAALVEELTRPIAAGVLHFEVQLWSQYTRSFEHGGDQGPEWVWDSARAGLLSPELDDAEGGGESARRRFGLDLFPESLHDTTDDVYPHRARVLLVVAGEEGAPARLAAELGAGETSMQLLSTDPLPELGASGFLKVGSEWVRYAGVSGGRITGLRRGERGTAARPHAHGTVVRAGKTLVLHVELEIGRDNWNG